MSDALVRELEAGVAGQRVLGIVAGATVHGRRDPWKTLLREAWLLRIASWLLGISWLLRIASWLLGIASLAWISSAEVKIEQLNNL
ncbi:hypothetical protein B566_EDAN016266 [Ephemera danica]|nr:hypothetical protein B566_EDAN016266 [Ephemera danica]